MLVTQSPLPCTYHVNVQVIMVILNFTWIAVVLHYEEVKASRQHEVQLAGTSSDAQDQKLRSTT